MDFRPLARVYANRDAAKRLGELILDQLAKGVDAQVIYLTLHKLQALGHGYLSAARIEQTLISGTRLPRSTVFYMPSGDLFLIAQRFTAESLRQLTTLIAANLEGQADGDVISALCQIFELPGDAIPLRKLIHAHLLGNPSTGRASRQTTRGAPAPANGGGPGAASASAEGDGASEPIALEGPLSLELLHHLQHLLDQIDVTPFIQQQTVFGREPAWRPRYVEHFFDISRLRAAHFPRIDLRASESLFIQFTRNLDELMLVQVLGHRSARSARIGLNLSISTVRCSTFERFSEHLSAEERRNVVCELHWIEFLQDIQDGGSALERLVRYGYGLALDRISAAVLPYLDLSGSRVDFIKVPFDRATMARIDPDIISALKRCDAGKLVLSACDDSKAVALGETLGIQSFQGRLIDRLVKQAA